KDAGVGTDGAALLDFFRKRTPSDADRQQMEQWVKQLGHATYRVREQATRELKLRGAPALPLVKKVLNDPDPETRTRARVCAEAIERDMRQGLAAAAARLLAVRRPAGALEVLLDYLPHADDNWVEEEVLAGLGELGLRQGAIDPLLSAALKDPRPARRGAAGFVLG